MTVVEAMDACLHARQNGVEIDTEVARWVAGRVGTDPCGALKQFHYDGLYRRTAMIEEVSAIISRWYGRSGDLTRLMMDMLGTYILNRKD